jgi:pilus assembly protein CpaB
LDDLIAEERFLLEIIMSLKTWLPLGAAVALGLAALFIVKNGMHSAPPAPREAVATIVTLKRDVSAGHEISAEDVTASDLSSPVAPLGTFKDPTEVIGRVAAVSMSQGQPVLEPMLASKGAVGGLQALVPPGMRAITIDVSETTSVGGMISPGCLVDVLITLNGDSTGPLTKTLVQGVRVEAVGQRMGPPLKDAPQEMFRSATLLVTPSQAESIELASTAGRPRLILRSNSDTADSQTTGVTLAELRGTRHSNADDTAITQQVANQLPSTQPVAQVTPVEFIAKRQPKPRRVVKVIKGGVETTVTFDLPRSQGTVVSTSEEDVFGN